MATPYSLIYERFLKKITDFNLVEMDDFSLNEMMLSWLKSAIVRVRACGNDLSKRNDELEEFECDLNDIEIELLSLGMTRSWLDQYLNSTENVLQFISGKESRYFSQANHINEIRALRDDINTEMQKLHNYHTYASSTYFNE